MAVVRIAAIAIALMVPAFAQERAVVTQPIVVTVQNFEIAGFMIRRIPRLELEIYYADNTGKLYTDSHPRIVNGQSDEANVQNLIRSLNKANLSVKSLDRHLMEHLQSEGLIPESTIEGTPR